MQTYLLNLCKHSGLDETQASVEINEDDQFVTVSLKLPVDESGLFIGFHGETLNSIQRLLRVIFQDQYPDKKIVLNVNEYREQRKEKLEELATNIAQRVLETGRQYTFSYMPPHERFIIHTTISDNPEFAELESISEGEGKDRVLMIRLKQQN